MNKNLVILMTLFCLIQCYSQKQGNIWYFGWDNIDLKLSGTGLDFNSGIPVILDNSAMPSTFGCSTYSNSVGELLFYSNGATVYDRSHQVMQNGDRLGGDPTTQQSVLIVPFVEDTNMYYIFTNDAYNPTNPSETGLHYSIINMSLNNGLGAVVNPKAISILSRNTEHLTGCNHSNRKDYWVITASPDSAKLYAFQVSEVGIHNPVISYLPLSSYQPWNFEICPTGNKIALTAYDTFNVANRYIINFDAQTGIFSIPFSLWVDPEEMGTWNTGYSFSPDGNLFYDIEHILNKGLFLFQYDLNASNIISSKLLIDTLNYFLVSDMQIGPDNKIYFANSENSNLDQIENPNNRGINCRYNKNGVFLGTNKICVFLPNETLYQKKITQTSTIKQNNTIQVKYDFTNKQLRTHFPDNKSYEIRIYDLQGNSIFNKESFNADQIDVEFLPAGLYIYSIGSEMKVLKSDKILIY